MGIPGNTVLEVMVSQLDPPPPTPELSPRGSTQAPLAGQLDGRALEVRGLGDCVDL